MAKEVDPTTVLQRVMRKLNSLPCCASDFLGRDLYRDVQIVLYGGPEDEECEDDEGEGDD